MENTKITWDNETKEATCTLYLNNGLSFVGKAKCHPDDEDMVTEKVGCEIALRRATILLLKSRKIELQGGYNALHQLYYSMKHSKKFNPKSYENIML